MIGGREALEAIARELGQARALHRGLAEHVRSLAERERDLVEEEREIIEALARRYLPELSPEAVSAGLRELRVQMEAALAKQEERADALGALLERAEAELARAEEALAVVEGEEERAASAVAEAQARAEAFLAGDEEYGRARAEHELLMGRREVLKRRRARLLAVANLERPRYESFGPFAYLRGRGYGEPRYRAAPLTAALDRWLAHRIDYDTLVRVHRILLEGPHAIQRELWRLRERIEELEAFTDDREGRAARGSGLVAALEAHGPVQGRLTAARTVADEARRRRNDVEARLRSVLSTRGTPWEEALAVHESFLASRTVQQLEGLVRATGGPDDDGLVERLSAVRDGLVATQTELQEAREELDGHARRAAGLADVERTAAARFASRRARFPGTGDIRPLLDAFAGGAVSVTQVVDRLGELHEPLPLLVLDDANPDGWLAELSSEFDGDFEIVEVETVTDHDDGCEVVIQDGDGRVVERRLRRRRS